MKRPGLAVCSCENSDSELESHSLSESTRTGCLLGTARMRLCGGLVVRCTALVPRPASPCWRCVGFHAKAPRAMHGLGHAYHPGI